ncbi:galactokinase [Nocardioides sp. SYSU D00038]|uniref:galactokinase n=1 Tax=Nocardioides sp. SYSU D00038 TaxID=2812554 RepID=UPI001967D69B|nr:galactokinase [Nocardioides sp. SYSU D00038]
MFLTPGDPDDLRLGAAAILRQHYGAEATVAARAPGRVNLIGEHVDYHRGPCLPLALEHATHVALRPRDDDRVRLVSRHSDEPWEGTLDECASATGWAAYAAGVLWALRDSGRAVPGLDLAVDSTVPVGAGLSSSAALECAVGVAVASLVDPDLLTTGRRELAQLCIRAEREVAGAPTGGLDQTVAMLAEAGAALLVDFDDDSTHQVPLDLTAEGLALLVTDTRVSHALVDGGYGARREDSEEAARRLGLESLREARLGMLDDLGDERLRRRARHVVTEIERVAATVDALESGDWTAVGGLLDASHASLRDDYEVSCAELDLATTTAREAGALGARMVGGGFGGSAVALVPAERVEAVAAAVDTAFAAAGHRPPAHLRAVASSGAALLG